MNLLKILLVFNVLFSSTIIFTQTSFNESFAGREWEFLQYKFRYKPDLKNVVKAFLATGLETSLVGLATYKIAKSYLNSIDCIDATFFSSYTTFLSCYVTFLFSFILHGYLLRKKSNFDTTVNFVKERPQNKNYTPESFRSSFDELYYLYLQDPTSDLFIEKVKEIMKIINLAITNRTLQLVYHVKI